MRQLLVIVALSMLLNVTPSLAQDVFLSQARQEDLIRVDKAGAELARAMAYFAQNYSKQMSIETKVDINILVDRLLMDASIIAAARSMVEIEYFHNAQGQFNSKAVSSIAAWIDFCLKQIKDDKAFSHAGQISELTDDQKNSIVNYYNNVEQALGRILEEIRK